ncbi:MAG: sugar ABC transporter permease [Candidatus Borkfalkiaceae bacterium]|nr:sugar ABC transporter permease [Clostridia bacterium]MDY6224100.1 sugar ABC transporter permease [Christensenellaceae bacterium]
MTDTTEGKRVKKSDAQKREKLWFMISVLALPTLGFLVFFVYVNFNSFLMAFQRPVYTDTGLVEKFSFDNFRRIFTAGGTDMKELLEALKNTMLFFFADTAVVFPISLLMCYFFFKKIAGYRFFRFVYYMPTIISSSVLVVLFKYSIGAGGILDAIATSKGETFISPLTQEPNALFTILFYSIAFGFAGNIIVLGGSMNGVSADVLEAGQIDGCNWVQELFLLIIPMMWPTISTMVILKFTGILSASGPILAFTKGEHGTMTLSYLLYALVSGYGKTKDLYYASAVGMVMTLFVFPLTMLIKHLIYSDKKEEETAL